MGDVPSIGIGVLARRDRVHHLNDARDPPLFDLAVRSEPDRCGQLVSEYDHQKGGARQKSTTRLRSAGACSAGLRVHAR